MGWNGPPLLEVANDDRVDIRASQPQPIDYSVIATAEPAEAAVADTQAEPAPRSPYRDRDDLPALPLPRHVEPLAEPKPVTTRPDTRDPSKPLPRHLAPAKPSEGLWGAMGQWLRSAGQLLASGFMVKKTRPRTPSPATMREATELTQLRAENRRLRMQLGDMMRTQTAPPTMDQRMMETRVKTSGAGQMGDQRLDLLLSPLRQRRHQPIGPARHLGLAQIGDTAQIVPALRQSLRHARAPIPAAAAAIA
jgi:hypothetical protein